jgi:hypothetical protein
MPAIVTNGDASFAGIEEIGRANARNSTPVAVPGCQSEMFRNVDVCLGSMAWRDSNYGTLISPVRRHVRQTRNAEAAGQNSIDRPLDDVRSKESEGKSHAGRPFADAFAVGDRLDAFDLTGDHFVEPSPPLGDGR